MAGRFSCLFFEFYTLHFSLSFRAHMNYYYLRKEIKEVKVFTTRNSWWLCHTCRLLIILHLILKGVLIAARRHELVHELLSVKWNDLNVRFQFFDFEQVVVIYGNKVAVEMRFAQNRFFSDRLAQLTRLVVIPDQVWKLMIIIEIGICWWGYQWEIDIRLIKKLRSMKYNILHV